MDSAELIRNLLQPFLYSDVILLDEINSTNRFAKNNPLKTPALISAEFQSEGRGRFDRTWLSDKGENLTFTVVFDMNLDNKNLFAVNFFISLVIHSVLKNILPEKNIVLKWPNDVLVENKKVCGVLSEIENLSEKNKRLIAGIGINVNQSDFRSIPGNNAASLKMFTGKNLDRHILLYHIAKKIILFKDSLLLPDRILFLWKKYSGFLGKKIRFKASGDSGVIEGIASDISPDGALVIITQVNKKVRFYSGEISFIF
jgi:BirA family biotin operon repressor/biotin-[acetyl-CoA-carboxylase] ligase